VRLRAIAVMYLQIVDKHGDVWDDARMVKTAARKPSALSPPGEPIRQKSGGSPPFLADGSPRRPVLCAESTHTHRTAVAYFRTSSATNVSKRGLATLNVPPSKTTVDVGADKDSLPRQQDAVRAYAQANGLQIVREFYDAAVSGADPVMSRAGFADMLAYILGNGARIVLVENASRFARDHMVQALGHDLLKKHGITLIPVDAPTHFTEDSPTANMLRTIISAVSQFEKEALVLKLRKSRDRKSTAAGERIEGNPRWKALRNPQAIAAARAARQRGLSLRAIAHELAQAGLCSASGKAYGAQSIKRMLGAS
jgi:DNA invertase Pin-like site-specific DNA recombinase